MICPICGNNIKDDSKFCGKCGSQVPRCPTCGRVILKPSKFCIHDGTPLPEEIINLFAQKGGNGQAGNGAANRNVSRQPVNGSAGYNVPRQPASGRDGGGSGTGGPANKKILIILIVVIAAIVVCGGIFAYLLKSGVISFKSADDDQKVEKVISADDEERDRSDKKSRTKSKASEDALSAEPEENAITGNASPADQAEPGNVPAMEDEMADPLIYFIMYSDQQYFTEADISTFDADMCRKARNGIYARLGRRFEDDTLTAYFNQFDWYIPTIEPENFTESMLNDYQIANRDLIVAYEAKMGYN